MREFERKRRKTGMPTALPQVIRDGVDSARQGDKTLALQPDNLNLHAAQRGAAGSVMKEKARTWLDSDFGKEWLEERAKLFLGGSSCTAPPLEAACPPQAAAPAKQKRGPAEQKASCGPLSPLHGALHPFRSTSHRVRDAHVNLVHVNESLSHSPPRCALDWGTTNNIPRQHHHTQQT